MNKATLHIIQGFLGAGKSTFSKKLSVDVGAMHFNPDEWVEKLFESKDYEKDFGKCFNVAMDTIWQKAVECLSSGTDVVLDMGFWHRKDRDYAKSTAEKCNANFKHYYICAPDEVLKQRLASRAGKVAENNVRKFDEIKKQFQEPETDENPIVIHS